MDTTCATTAEAYEPGPSNPHGDRLFDMGVRTNYSSNGRVLGAVCIIHVSRNQSPQDGLSEGVLEP